MPRQPGEQYYSEEEVREMVELINTFADEYSPWQSTQARKQHEDLFGEVIKAGEMYFKQQCGPAFHDVLKLSALSMERLCFVLFQSTVLLKPMARQLLEERRKRLFKAFRKISFGITDPEKKHCPGA